MAKSSTPLSLRITGAQELRVCVFCAGFSRKTIICQSRVGDNSLGNPTGAGNGGRCDLISARRCQDARGLLAEAAQAAGLLGSRAMVLEAAGQLSGEESASICRSAAKLLRRLIVVPDPGAALPSRFPLNLLEHNAVEGLMQLCSSAACPPAILPPGRTTELAKAFATIPEITAQGASGGSSSKVGAQVSVASGPNSNPRLRLALGRLGWLAATGQLRGPRGQGAVAEECSEVEAWRTMFGEMLLPNGERQ